MTSPLQQKLRITGPSIVTANRVSDGVVIYRTAHNSWSEKLADAAVVHNVAEASPLLAAATADDVYSTGAYVAPVKISTAGAIEPGNLRETIRHSGLTIDMPVSA